jgi:hypothetical protein
MLNAVTISYCGFCNNGCVSVINVLQGLETAHGYSTGVPPSSPFTLPVVHNFPLNGFLAIMQNFLVISFYTAR